MSFCFFLSSEAISVNWLDLVFLSLILISGLLSLYRGFVREIFSLLTWVVAIWAGIQWADLAAVYLPEALTDATLRLAGGFTIVFVLVLIVGGVLGVVAAKLVRGSGLSSTDRSLGVVFGLLRGVLIVALLVFLAGLTLVPQESWWQESRLVPEFQRVVDWILSQLPEAWREHLVNLHGTQQQD